MANPIPIFSITPCCPNNGEQIQSFIGTGFQPMFNNVPGVFIYQGPNQILNGIQFLFGNCYTVVQTGTVFVIEEFEFDFSLFNQTPVETCSSNLCNSCFTVGPPVLVTNVVKFVSCCTKQEIYFSGSLPYTDGTVVSYTGDSIYFGFGGALVPAPEDQRTCYTIFLEAQDSIPTYPQIEPVANLLSPVPGCEDDKCFCPTLSSECYLIVPCDGTNSFVSSNQDFAQYVNSFVVVTDGQTSYEGCAYVIALSFTSCEEDLVTTQGETCECSTNCYYVSNTLGFFYVDNNNVLQDVSSSNAQPYLKVCSKIPPIPQSGSLNPQVINLGSCEEDTCTVKCVKLENCQNPSLVIYTITESILPYLYGTNNIVSILGKEGCWKVLELENDEICDCPVDVTVTASYSSCSSCIGVIAYKLTSCEDNSTIHTYSNLEAYVNRVVKTDCGCYLVEKINYPPPTPQDVQIEAVYPDCISCSRVYWKLTDCKNGKNSVITYTDLSLFVNKVIKIEGCPECWLVESTQEYINAIQVKVTDDYSDCDECEDLICECTTITNLNETLKSYSYLDCDNTEKVIQLEPGETSSKVCATKWITDFNNLDIFKTFGECKFGICPPPVFKNNRTVKPGYNTPNCNPDEYDKITCKSADAVYKIVLEKRYGITNCCPEDDEKWLMKKELIDLQSLKDPNYNCPSCPCSCNSGKSYSTCNCGN
jgi:hypothetical protein